MSTVKTQGYVYRPTTGAPYRLGKCQDCGELYAWERVACWRLRHVYAGIYCAQCGSELDLRRTRWGQRKALLLPTGPRGTA
jgi:hypothetical protein